MDLQNLFFSNTFVEFWEKFLTLLAFASNNLQNINLYWRPKWTIYCNFANDKRCLQNNLIRKNFKSSEKFKTKSALQGKKRKVTNYAILGSKEDWRQVEEAKTQEDFILLRWQKHRKQVFMTYFFSHEKLIPKKLIIATGLWFLKP